MSKDTSGLESPQEVRRGWTTVLKTTRSRQLYQGYEGVSSGEAKLIQIFIKIEPAKVRRVSPKVKNFHTPEGQEGWRTGAKLRKEPEGRNLKPEEGGPDIKKQVQTLSMRKGVRRKQGSRGSSKHLLSRGRARGMADAHLVQNVLPNPGWGSKKLV
ncbi:hypothetical protein Tco_1273515 [Tanacetum coccineum]